MVITVKVVKVLPEPLPQFTFKDDRIRTEYYTKKILIDNQDGVITHLELFFFFKPRANDYTTKQLILLKGMFKASACYVGDLGYPWVGKIPWRRKWQPTPVFLPGESHGQRSLVGYSPRGHKESDTTERLHFYCTNNYITVYPTGGHVSPS